MYAFLTTLLRYIAYGVLIGIYAVFAWAGKIPMESFTMALTAVFGVLGAVHISNNATVRAAPPFLVETPASQPVEAPADTTTIINRS